MASKKRVSATCVVKARCIACKTIRIVSEEDVPKGHYPMCRKCFMPLVAVSATLTKGKE